MAAYRVYLLDHGGGIQARQDFAAPSDADALLISRCVAEACADCYAGFELWSLARCIVPARALSAAAPPHIDELSHDQQERLLEIEESLLHSAWRVAASRGLNEACERLRHVLSGKPRSVTPSDIVRYVRAATGAEMMSFQLVEDERVLRLRGTHGFEPWFEQYFAIVRGDDDCCCGAAFKHIEQLVVPEVETSPIFAGRHSLEVLRAARVAACVSTPLVNPSDGTVQGVFSVHRRKIWNPESREIDRLKRLAREIATAMSDRLSPEATLIRQPT